MKQKLAYIILSFLFIGCNNAQQQDAGAKNADIFKDYMTWYQYTYQHIKLAQDFNGRDTEEKPLDKEKFLQALATGKFYVMKVNDEANLPTYKLFTLKDTSADIRNTVKQLAEIELQNYHRVGETFPAFSFKDLNGIVYDNANTKGKTVVIKCWFIHCVACVNEFPVVNKIVDGYKKRSDVVFISLAYDSEKELRSFLSTRSLKYPTASVHRELLQDELKLTAYPTHIVIGKDGKISGFFNEAADLESYLKKYN